MSKKMNRDIKRNKRGFTLAEVMIVVAITMILSAFGFVAVINYLRSYSQLEMDGIAKEMFIAAQNHLSMAESQGLLEEIDKGNSEGNDVYYFIVGDNDSYPDSGYDDVLDLILPFGSIDDTARLGGSYIIRYQYNASRSRILDVFYSSESLRYGHTFTDSDYAEVMNIRSSEYRRNRRYFGSDNSVIGYYGGEDALSNITSKKLETPSVEVVNGDRLYVKINNSKNCIGNSLSENADGMNLKLLIKGKTSGASKVVYLIKDGVVQDSNNSLSELEFVLDDITVFGKHFEEQFPELLAGENISVEVVADNSKYLSNVVSGGEVDTNGLYGNLDSSNTAIIKTIRHLENLGKSISNHEVFESEVSAKLEADLDWNQYVYNIKNENNVTDVNVLRYNNMFPFNGINFIPVSNDVKTTFTGSKDGDSIGYSINNVVINCTNVYDTTVGISVGIFDSLTNGSRISNVRFIDCDIRGYDVRTENIGTVAGYANNTTFDNIAVYATSYFNADVYYGRNAGGIVGNMNGGSIVRSSASVPVNATVNAGGLVGNMNAASISGSYSGGHTVNGKYSDTLFNVTGNSTGGGLAGYSSYSSIINSFSTCSAVATYAGGLAGRADDMNRVDNNYATGSISALTAGTLFGSYTGTDSISDNTYLESTNIIRFPVGTNSNLIAIVADKDINNYSAFLANTYNNLYTRNYDSTLEPNFYPYKTTYILSNNSGRNDFYGDWPQIESYVKND